MHPKGENLWQGWFGNKEMNGILMQKKAVYAGSGLFSLRWLSLSDAQMSRENPSSFGRKKSRLLISVYMLGVLISPSSKWRCWRLASPGTASTSFNGCLLKFIKKKRKKPRQHFIFKEHKTGWNNNSKSNPFMFEVLSLLSLVAGQTFPAKLSLQYWKGFYICIVPNHKY